MIPSVVLQRFQVLQRDSEDKARVLLRDGSVLELVVGGPYTVDGVEDIMVGDLYVLGGQSNMSGRGDLRDKLALEKPHPNVRLFQSSEIWSVAKEPLFNLCESPYQIHRKLGGIDMDPHRWKGAGCGLTFGVRLCEIDDRVAIGLIPTAHGGTSMSQWIDGVDDGAKDTLFNAMISGIRKASAGGKVKGVLWYQGESDTSSDEDASYYTERTALMIERTRAILGDPTLPFFCCQIGRTIVSTEKDPSAWNRVREEQRKLATTIPGVRLTTSIDLDLIDWIHLNTSSQKMLGRRFANLVCMPSMVLSNITLVTDPIHPDAYVVRISFRDVPGGELKTEGRPCGFSLRAADEKNLSIVYKSTLEGSDVLLWVNCATVLAEGTIPVEMKAEWWKVTSVWYGYGFDPYCNVLDAEGGAMPGFGPMPIKCTN